MGYTKKNTQRKSVQWKGWSKLAPKGAQRTRMYKKCGKKCFLGTKTHGDKQHPDFPICATGTCKINKKGLMSAYIRAKQWGKSRKSYKTSKPSFKRSYYTNISRKAKKMLQRFGESIGH